MLIHFDGWNQRYDEWIDMNSERIRPLVRHSERKEKSKRVKTVREILTNYYFLILIYFYKFVDLLQDRKYSFRMLIIIHMNTAHSMCFEMHVIKCTSKVLDTKLNCITILLYKIVTYIHVVLYCNEAWICIFIADII